jgi:uncharacterized protein (TIGR00299 family) protein
MEDEEMTIVYAHCFSGASGDMFLGAIIDAGVDPEALREELAKVPIDGYRLSFSPVRRRGLAGTKCTVEVTEDQPERDYQDIVAIIDNSTLPGEDKAKIKAIFKNLGEAEAKAHGRSLDHIHFHEVGAVDSIVDVVGAVVGLRLLGAQTLEASPLHVGSGFVHCQHGTIPVPAPATVELLKGIPIYSRGIEGELVTPTGAAILATLAGRFGPYPQMKVAKVGYGAGSRELEIPNLLRLVVGAKVQGEGDWVRILEANIDDMNPELYEHVIDELLAKGALDVYLTPVIMKKSRPGVLLTVISPLHLEEALRDCIFAQTTTIGLRVGEMERHKLVRELREVETPYGRVLLKAARGFGQTNWAPEYASCRELATKTGVPLKEIYRVALAHCTDAP